MSKTTLTGVRYAGRKYTFHRTGSYYPQGWILLGWIQRKGERLHGYMLEIMSGWYFVTSLPERTEQTERAL